MAQDKFDYLIESFFFIVITAPLKGTVYKETAKIQF